jgi:hypothetical protein
MVVPFISLTIVRQKIHHGLPVTPVEITSRKNESSSSSRPGGSDEESGLLAPPPRRDDLLIKEDTEDPYRPSQRRRSVLKEPYAHEAFHLSCIDLSRR